MQNEKTSDRAASTSDANGLENLGVAAAAGAIRNGEVTAESYAAALLRRAQAFGSQLVH